MKISFIANDSGVFKLSVPGKECWNLDSFLQEITFQHGLYYYLCGASNRREVARFVVKPIFEELLVSRFSVAYPVQIQKHLLEGSLDWAGGEFLEATAHAYEVLFQKLQLKMVSGYEFIRNTDDLLTEFMLQQLGHLREIRVQSSTSWSTDVANKTLSEPRRFESFSTRSTP